MEAGDGASPSPTPAVADAAMPESDGAATAAAPPGDEVGAGAGDAPPAAEAGGGDGGSAPAPEEEVPTPKRQRLDEAPVVPDVTEPSATPTADAPGATVDASVVDATKQDAVPERKTMDIDGAALESEGHLLLAAATCAALMGKSVRVLNIRDGHRCPGLIAQHLAALRLLRDLSAGALENDSLGSKEVVLSAGALAPGRDFGSDPGSGGSMAAALHAALCPLLFTGGDCSCSLRGGTDVGYGPPLEFFSRVLRPLLAEMGANFSLDCQSRGFFPGGGGVVHLNVSRLKRKLRPLELTSRGRPSVIHVIMHSTHPLGDEADAAVEAARSALVPLVPEVRADLNLEPGPEGKFKFWISAVLQTTSGARFFAGIAPRELPYCGRVGVARGFRGITAMVMESAIEIRDSLSAQLESGAAIGEHLCDHLILPAALAKGTSRFLVREVPASAHAVIHAAELMVPGVVIQERPLGSLTMLEIEGVGQPVPGEEPDEPQPPPPPPMPPVHEPEAAASASEAPAAPAAAAAAAPEPAAPVPTPKAAVPAPPFVRTSGPEEDVLTLRAGALQAADKELLQDLRRDMGELSAETGLKVEVDIAGNRLVVRGPAEVRDEVQADLHEVLDFYFPP